MTDTATSRPIKVPGPDHPITIEPHTTRLTVRVGEALVADTTAALVLREAHYEPVYYIPREDVDASVLVRSSTESYCPYKGDAAYYAVRTADGALIEDAIWTYEQPFPAVAPIAGHLAFYPQNVTFGGN